MKSFFRRAVALMVLVASTNVASAQLPSAPALATTNVTEAAQYGVLYELNLPASANYSTLASILYTVNNSSLTLSYNRIAYFMQLDTKWVWVSMNKFNTTNAQLGIPYAGSGIVFQQTVSAMNVVGSSGSGVTNANNITGNIEIWPDCYDVPLGLGGIGGNGSNYDFNDTRNAGTNCYGSFQVHNYNSSQTIFAFNCFMGGPSDIGIGNNSGNSNPDWTFMHNAASFTTKKLYILVQNGISIQTQPSTVAKTACINGTVSALSLSTSINSGTISNYQWYGVSTATNSGGTLLSTITTTATSCTFTPPTAAAGNQYYYCVVNGTGGFVATSSVSGQHTVLNPTLSVNGAAAICIGSSISLSTSSSFNFTSYVWSNSGTGGTQLISPSSTTSYSVMGTTSIGCVANSAPVTVTVNGLPVISVAGGSICAGASFVFSPSGASSYTYSSGSATVNPASTTNYTISGTSSQGCVATVTDITVQVNNLPIVAISGTTALCTGANASLTASGATGYTWSTGSNAASISVSPTTTSVYTVIGVSAEGCESASAAVTTITVYSLPSLSILGSNTVCLGSSVQLSAAGAQYYSWNTGATTTSISVSPTVTSNYSISGMDSNGCVSSTGAIATVSVITLPNVTITGSASICAGGSSTLTAGGASSYTWSNGSNAASIAVSPSTTTSYSLYGEGSEGCLSTSPSLITVTVNALPVISVAGTNTICAGGSTTLTASGAGTFTWNTGSNANNLTVSPTGNTVYTVNGTSAEGCVSASSATMAVTVYSLPIVTISGTSTLCNGSSGLLTANGANSYTWSTGSNATSITISPTTNAVYALLGAGSEGCVSSSSAIASVSVHALPLISISGTNTLCIGSSVNLTASGASTYTWNTGANTAILSLSPGSNTVVSVSGTSSLGCTSAVSATQNITVHAIPVLSISAVQSSLCVGASVQLNALGASNYSWSGNGTAAAITVTPGTTTVYTLAGSSAQGCQAVPVTKTITVNTLPNVSITSTAAICSGSSATLTASGAASYSWSGLGTGSSVAVSPTSTTVYTVTGLSVAGCSQTGIYTLTVNQLPNVVIAGSSGVCTGQNATLTVNGASSYLWSTGATTGTIITSPISNTTYTVFGTDALGCVKTATQLVTVAANLSVTISGQTLVCAGDNVSLTAGGASTYTWNTSETTQTIAPTPSTTTTYSVIGSTGGCSNTAVTTISVNARPSITIAGATVACLGDSIALSAGGADTYTWSNASNNATIIVVPATSTVYTAVGSFTTGCSNSAQISISLYNLPSVSMSGNTVLCMGDGTQLTATGATTYTWSTGANGNSISITPTVSGNYFVVGTDANGCKDSSAVVMLTVNPVPSLSVAATETALCKGNSVTYTVSGALVYLWNNNSTSNVVSYTPTSTTGYTVSGTNTFACTSTTVINVAVNPLPTLSISSASSICLSEGARLIVSGAATYTWTNGFVGDTLVVSPVVTTTYSVNALSAEGCSGAANFELKVLACTGIDKLDLGSKVRLYPNPSTGYVTVELPDAESYRIVVRNSLGQILMQQNTQGDAIIDLRTYDNGLYYISILQSQHEIHTLPLLKN